jgi:hypothetical protein
MTDAERQLKRAKMADAQAVRRALKALKDYENVELIVILGRRGELCYFYVFSTMMGIRPEFACYPVF